MLVMKPIFIMEVWEVKLSATRLYTAIAYDPLVLCIGLAVSTIDASECNSEFITVSTQLKSTENRGKRGKEIEEMGEERKSRRRRRTKERINLGRK